jgi:hypothetical protein
MNKLTTETKEKTHIFCEKIDNEGHISKVNKAMHSL